MLKKLKGKQRGFTMIELLVIIALTGIIGTAATMSIHQILTGTALSNNQNTAINQVRNAGHWISRDAQMANNVTDSPEDGNFLKLTWTSWSGGNHIVAYSLLESSSGLKELWRDYDGQRTLIAQYIDPYNTNCTWHEVTSILTVTMTATVGDKTETRTFKIRPRPVD